MERVLKASLSSKSLMGTHVTPVGVRVWPGVPPREDQLPPPDRRDSPGELETGLADRDDAAAAQEGIRAAAALHGLARLRHPELAPVPVPTGQPGFSAHLLLVTLKLSFSVVRWPLL